MAYTPDKAFEDMEEVGQKAFLLFSFYCKHGSMSNNRVKVSLESGAKFLGVVYENACRLNAVLKKKGWIKLDKGETVLLKGWQSETDENNSRNFATQENGTNAISSKTDKFVSFEPKKDESLVITKVEKTDEFISFEVEKLTKPTVLEFPAKLKTDENNSQKLTKTTVAYKEEPALSNQQEEKDISTEISKKKKASRIPDDFSITGEMRKWAKEKVPTVNLEFETENFVDHYKNAAGSKGVGQDWEAKWRTWMRNSFTEFGKYPNGKPVNGANGNGNIQPNSNGNHQDKRAERAVVDYNVVEQARANSERRRLAKLQGSNAPDS